MKKTIIIAITTIICSAIIGASLYAIQFNKSQSIEKQQQIKLDQLNKEKDDYFKKKIECEQYSKKIKDDLETTYNGIDFSAFGIRVSFEFIFYSPKDNSCLYVTQFFGSGGREYFIHNALTKSKITSFKFPDQFDDYKKFILEYSDGEIRL